MCGQISNHYQTYLKHCIFAIKIKSITWSAIGQSTSSHFTFPSLLPTTPSDINMSTQYNFSYA